MRYYSVFDNGKSCKMLTLHFIISKMLHIEVIKPLGTMNEPRHQLPGAPFTDMV